MAETVLVHPRPDLPTNSPYVLMLHGALRSAGIEPVAANPRNALRYPGAAVHVQWPEYLLSHPRRLGRLTKLGNATLLLLDIMFRGRRSVWTAHNLEPHYGGWSAGEARFFRRWRKHITDVIVLCDGQEREIIDTFPDLENARFTHIPSGHLHPHDLHIRPQLANDEPVSFLHLGTIARYKCQLEVIEGLTPYLRSGRARLTIAGAPGDDHYASRVASLVASLPNVELIDRRVPEDELAVMAREHRVAVGVQTGFNTGVVPAMVPFGLPVVLHPGCQSEFFKRQLGDLWIHELVDSNWSAVIEWARTPRERAPDLSIFDWGKVAADHRRLLAT